MRRRGLWTRYSPLIISEQHETRSRNDGHEEGEWPPRQAQERGRRHVCRITLAGG